MKDDKPLITKNQAIYMAHRAKTKPIEKIHRKHFIIREITITLLTFIIAIILVNYPAFSHLVTYTFSSKPATSQIQPTKNITPPPKKYPLDESKIIIPKISTDAPIIWDINFDQIHSNLDNGVVQYKESAKPGQYGNVFLVGHSSDYVWSKGKYKTVFSLLPKLIKDDQIFIHYQGDEYIYEVTETKIVAPTDTSILDPSTDARLTLMTCWPIGTSQKRYVVIAKLISPSPSGSQNSAPNTSTLPSPR